TTLIYNGFGDLIQKISPAAGTFIYTYDSAGDLLVRMDARGVVETYSYDALGCILTVGSLVGAAENATDTYDKTGANFGFGLGRLTSVVDAAGTLTRGYDERGNMLTESRTRTSRTPAVTLTTAYTYDNADRVASIVYPSGALLAY